MNPTDTPSGTAAAEAVRDELLGVPARRVVAVADTTGVTRRLTTTAFTDLAAGRVGVLARPGMRRTGWLAADLLRALGCRDDVTGAGRAGEGDWTLVAAWLRTHQVRHLYVQHAWTLPLRVLDELLNLLDRTRTTLWLVGDTPFTDAHTEALAPWTAHPVAGEQFTAAWADLPTTGTERSAAVAAVVTARTPAPWPQQLPDDDFTTFRAACRDLLAPAQFGVADAYFRRQVVVHRAAVDGMVERGELAEQRIAALLQDQWENASSMAQFLTFIRAAQVAFFLAGHYLQVDLDQLIGTASVMPRRALRTAETWARLHAYPEPHRAAVCALAAAGVGVEAIGQVTVGGCDPDAAVVTLADGTEAAVEPHARVFLTAQWHLRQLQAATDDALLFPARGGGPLSASALVQVINDARRELGVAVAPARIDRKPITGDRWLTRWGISIQELL